jgi:hypothetical protein
MDMGIDMRRHLQDLEHDSKVEVDDIITLVDNSGVVAADDEVPDFTSCVNYAGIGTHTLPSYQNSACSSH